MINIAGQLHAATAEGVLVSSAEVKDEAQNKSQAQINALVAQQVEQLTEQLAAASIDLDEDEVDAIMSGVTVSDKYILFKKDSETVTAYRHADADEPAGQMTVAFATAKGDIYYMCGYFETEDLLSESSGMVYEFINNRLVSINYATAHGFRYMQGGGITN